MITALANRDHRVISRFRLIFDTEVQVWTGASGRAIVHRNLTAVYMVFAGFPGVRHFFVGRVDRQDAEHKVKIGRLTA